MDVRIYLSVPWKEPAKPDTFAALTEAMVAGLKLAGEQKLGRPIPLDTPVVAALLVVAAGRIDSVHYRPNPTQQELRTGVFEGRRYYPLQLAADVREASFRISDLTFTFGRNPREVN